MVSVDDIHTFIEKKILVVDDSSMVRETLSSDLMSAELGLGVIKVDTAENGEVALTLVKKSLQEGRIYDLILLDWNMPVLNGLEALKALRAMPEMKVCPIIMLTAESEPANLQKAKEAGANFIINKPFNRDKLKKFLKALPSFKT